MYKIKRHKILNLFYLHDPYSGPITEEYELVAEVAQWSEVHRKLKGYQENSTPNVEGIFEDYYKYQHMKELWGDPSGLQPLIGQLFFICCKEMHSQKRTLFELCEVKALNEPKVIYYNHVTLKQETFTISAFQGLVLIPERDEAFIQNWESKAKIRYPRNLISTLSGINDYRQIRNREVRLSQHNINWDLPKCALKKIATGA